MARSCGHDHVPQVHACTPSPDRITVVVLAAGASTRMGRPKATLPLKRPHGAVEGEPACRRIVRLCHALGFGRSVVVLGHHADVVRAACADLADFAINPAPDRGMFSSVQVGARVAMEVPAPPHALMIWPVDCPLMSIASLTALLEAGNPYVAREGMLWVRRPGLRMISEPTGHPVILSAALARRVIDAPADARLDVLLNHPDVLPHTVLLRDNLHRLNLNTTVDAEPFVVADPDEDEVDEDLVRRA